MADYFIGKGMCHLGPKVGDSPTQNDKVTKMLQPVKKSNKTEVSGTAQLGVPQKISQPKKAQAERKLRSESSVLKEQSKESHTKKKGAVEQAGNSQVESQQEEAFSALEVQSAKYSNGNVKRGEDVAEAAAAQVTDGPRQP